MKKITLFILLALIVSFGLGRSPVSAESAADRPVISIDYYGANTIPARGEDFEIVIIFKNSGQKAATNMIIEFTPGDLIPRDTGGLQTINQLIIGETKGLSQNFTVSSELWDAKIANSTVSVTYSDYDGNIYNEIFTLAVNLKVPSYGASVPTPTPTPAAIFQPQLVIQSFSTDEAILQPGTIFELSLNLTNLGNAAAKSVSMILGGGNIETNPEGTPQPGISGSSGDFSHFAPIDSSNIKYIGDILPSESIAVSQRIIVNVDTNAGAHSLDYSFVYLTGNEQKVVDNQMITLLVYKLPSLQVDFSMEPGPFYANQPNVLPLQVVNLGKQTVILGNMLVAASEAQLENNVALVGAVEPGFYFNLDPMIIPNQAGPLDVLVGVNYADDFNQARVYETTLTIDVIEMDMGDFAYGDDMYPSGEDFEEWNFQEPEETFWQKLLRVIKGLLGLDSGIKNEPEFFIDEGMPRDLP